MSFSIQRIPFDKNDVDDWAQSHKPLTNWPVVYVLDGEHRSKKLYVGETTSAQKRMRQHLANPRSPGRSTRTGTTRSPRRCG